jgi:hypothetical protein
MWIVLSFFDFLVELVLVVVEISRGRRLKRARLRIRRRGGEKVGE